MYECAVDTARPIIHNIHKVVDSFMLSIREHILFSTYITVDENLHAYMMSNAIVNHFLNNVSLQILQNVCFCSTSV